MTNTNIDRKLVAILFADIAGYTAVMQRNELKARKYIQVFNEQIHTSVAEFKGSAVQFYGDGCICVFQSAVNALECAVQLQRNFTNEGVPVRVGIHSGDAYFSENNVYGDSVNIASRIESIAVPGSILFSERVKKDIKNQPQLRHVFLANVEFKNVDDAIAVYALDLPGIKTPLDIDPAGKVSSKPRSLLSTTSKGISLLISLLVIILLMTSNWDTIKDWMQGSSPGDEKKTVAVLDFENVAGNEELTAIASIATSRIVHGITQHDLARVITGEVIESYREVMKSSIIPMNNIEFLSQEMDVTEVFKGVAYANGNDLFLECTVLDAATNEVIKGLPTIQGAINDPMPAIEEQRELILGYIAQTQDKKLNLSLETQPPKYAAYKEFILAKKQSNDEEAEKYLLRAMDIDPNYFEPKVYLISNYYNQDRYVEADSLLEVVMDIFPDSEPRQGNIINFYKALLNGKNDIAYQCMFKELDFAPFDLPTNQTVMVLGTQHTRHLEEALEVYKMIPEDKIDLTDCSPCQIRAYVKGYVELEQGRTQDAIKTGLELLRNNGEYWASDILIRGYAITNDWVAMEALSDQLQAGSAGFDAADIYLKASKEAFVAGAREQARAYAVKVTLELADSEDVRLVEAHWLSGDTTEAIRTGYEYLDKEPESWRTYSILIAHALIEEDIATSTSLIEKLEDQRSDYQYGGVDYALACAYGMARQDTEALAYLKSAVLQGKWNNYSQFQHDVAFVDVRTSDEFKAICNYWNE